VTTLVVGTDEAGYGPNLGPLVIGATAWEAAAAPGDVEPLFAAAAADLAGVWGDSKVIHRGGGGFAALERGALVAASAGGEAPPPTWSALLAAVGCEAPPAEWTAVADDLRLPCAADRAACAAAGERAAAALAAHGLKPVAVRCRVVQPAEFNGLLDAGLNKSDILSRATLDLAAALVRRARADSVVWCDRHGGRMRYAALVSRSFAAPLVRVVAETPRWSAYHVAGAACRVEFAVGGESRLPVAVASMTAKYVRELAMRAFNAWWCGRAPGLAATAGYPLDAARWRRDAAAAVEAAGLGWDAVWRRA
jgi:hypothetical protein